MAIPLSPVPFISYAIAYNFFSNTKTLLLACDFSNPTPTGTLPLLQQYGHYSTFCFPQHSPGLSKALLKGLPFILYFIKVTTNSGNNPTSPGKALTLVKKMCFGDLRCVYKQGGAF